MLVYMLLYTNIGGILMVNVTIYSIHGSYGYDVICIAIEKSCIDERNFDSKVGACLDLSDPYGLR